MKYLVVLTALLGAAIALRTISHSKVKNLAMSKQGAYKHSCTTAIDRLKKEPTLS